jgi:hypothetical protein
MKALAQYATLYFGDSIIARWQNYYIDQTVEVGGLQYSYAMFEALGLESGDMQSEGTLEISFAASNDVVSLLVSAIRDAYYMRIETYSFDPRQGNGEPQSWQRLVGSYTGQITKATRQITTLLIEIGTTLSPIGSQVPPRNFTSRIIGAPCRLDQ